jgi:hypothetical protein
VSDNPGRTDLKGTTYRAHHEISCHERITVAAADTGADGSRTTLLDGGRWPQSSDAGVERPSLIATLDSR